MVDTANESTLTLPAAGPAPAVCGAMTLTGAGRESVHVTPVGFQQTDKIVTCVFRESVLAAEPMAEQARGCWRAVGMAAWYSLCRRQLLFLSYWLHFPCTQSLSCSPQTMVICTLLGSLRSAQ